jgi:phage-related protein
MSFLQVIEEIPDDISKLTSTLENALNFPQQITSQLSSLFDGGGWLGDAAKVFQGGVGSSITGDLNNALGLFQSFINAVSSALKVIFEVIGVIADIVNGVVSVIEDIGNAIASVY